MKEAEADARRAAARPADDFTGAKLFSLSVPELEQLVLSLDHPKYRGKQIMDKLLKGVKRVPDLLQVHTPNLTPSAQNVSSTLLLPPQSAAIDTRALKLTASHACSCPRGCAMRWWSGASQPGVRE